jgi:hypothetical protein
MEVKGRNLSEGIPRSFTISSNEILEALTDPLNQIVSSVKIALEQTPPELGADIAERGMMLTGGGALLRDLDRTHGQARQHLLLRVSLDAFYEGVNNTHSLNETTATCARVATCASVHVARPNVAPGRNALRWAGPLLHADPQHRFNCSRPRRRPWNTVRRHSLSKVHPLSRD